MTDPAPSETRPRDGATQTRAEPRAGLERERLVSLVRAAEVLTSDLRFDAVIAKLVDEVVTLLRADAADCWILDRDRRYLTNRAVMGLPESEIGRRIPPSGTIGEAIATGRPVLKRRFSSTERPPPSVNYASFEDVMVAPITWLGEIRGILGVCAREDERFQAADLELLDAFARLASLALNNAESFEERARQARIQRGFFRIADVLGSPLSLAETLDALAQAAGEALGGDAALVLEPRGGLLTPAGAFELPAELAAQLAGGIPASAGPFQVGGSDERIVTSGRLGGDDRFAESFRELLGGAGYRALLCAPVSTGDELAAVLVLFAEERSFTDDDLVLAHQLAGAAHGALERSELFETERRARNLSERLAPVESRLVTSLEPAVVLDEVVREAAQLLGADAAVIRLLEGDELVVRAATGPGTERITGARASSGVGLAGDVAQSRSPRSVQDAHVDSRLSRSDPLLARMIASVAAPMIAHGGRLHGVLNVYCEEARAWREDEVQALVALAAVGSAALTNAELYQRVAEEKERSDAILANIADGIVALDRDERIVLWNAAAERITGVPAGEALGGRVGDVLQRELGAEGRARGERQVAILRGGKEVWLSVTEAVMLDPAGAVGGRIFAFRDVSGERVVEEMKSGFVATVSHELRSPLTSIYGFAETLLRHDVGFDDEQRSGFLGYIVSESERLIRIVDDLLSVARLEVGALDLAVADVELAGLAAEAVAIVGEQAGEGRPITLDLPEDPIVVRADRAKLSQVLTNLLDNAVKYSPGGGTITVAARRRSDAVEVRVTDAGLGISPDQRDLIFAKFYRVEPASADRVQGTGLGLFLVRGLLAAMGGRIWVESEEGIGSSFVFELPLGRPKLAELEELEPVGRS